MHIVGNEDADLKTVIELGEFTASQAKTLGDLREIMHTQPRYYMSMLRTPKKKKKCLYSELFYFIFPCVQTQYREIKYLSVFRTTPNTETFYGASTKQHFKFAHVTAASKNEHSQTFGANTRRTWA